jgi:hypothetical protein
VCGWRCQIRAKDDQGFVRRGGGSAWTGRIGNGTEDAARPVTPARRAGWLQGAPLGLGCRSGHPPGVDPQQHVDAASTRHGKARLTADHHRQWTADRARRTRAPASGGLPAASSHQPDGVLATCLCDPAAELGEDASARLREHLALPGCSILRRSSPGLRRERLPGSRWRPRGGRRGVSR